MCLTRRRGLPGRRSHPVARAFSREQLRRRVLPDGGGARRSLLVELERRFSLQRQVTNGQTTLSSLFGGTPTPYFAKVLIINSLVEGYSGKVFISNTLQAKS